MDCEMIKAIARAIAGAEWDRGCSALGIPNYPRGGNWSAKLPEARAAYSVMAGQQVARPTPQIGEDELVEISDRLTDTACALRSKRMLDHASRCASAAVALSQAADRLILYREALAEVFDAAGRWVHDGFDPNEAQALRSRIDTALSRSSG